MSVRKRATVYVNRELHRALRLKAALTERTISDLVSAAIRRSLAEDADDLAAISERNGVPTRPFEDFVAELRERGDV